MKTIRALLALFTLPLAIAGAQEPASAAVPVSQLRAPQELEQIVAPIALYPDALIAIILPASTAPADVVLAARHLRDNANDRSQIEHRAWDESVKSLTNYPEVLQWMDENLDWVKQLGQSFAAQPADVMQAVQRLRAKARANGTLADTPQQQVIAEPDVIRIVPAQPDIIYVPRYEPDIVFVDRPVYPYAYGRPFFTFGIGVPVGSWLAFDCDWRRHTIWVGNRHRPWSGHDWRRPIVTHTTVVHSHARPPEVRAWRPHPSTTRVTVVTAPRPHGAVARPTPIGTPPSHRPGPRNGFNSDTRTVSQPRNEPTVPPQVHHSAHRGRPTTAVTAPPLPAQPPLTRTIPPTNTGTVSVPRERGGDLRTHQEDNRNRGPRNYGGRPDPGSGATVNPSAPASVAPPPQPAPRYERHAPRSAPPASTVTSPSATASLPDYRGHSRSAPPPAATATPPPSAPATTTAPANPPPRPDRRGGRSGDPER